MKKTLLIIGILLTLSTMSYAQTYIGGALNLGFSNSKEDSKKIENRFNIGISPRIGFQVGDKISVGVELGLSYGQQKEFDPDVKIKVASYNIAPFMRYDWVRFGKFAIATDTKLGYSWSKLSSKPTDPSFTTYASNVYLSIDPVITMDISKKLTFEVRLDFLSLNLNHSYVWNRSGSEQVTDFAFGLDSDKIFNLGDLTFGIIYKF